jgi:pimeloyl-ACP methyl ester carboxylesterase
MKPRFIELQIMQFKYCARPRGPVIKHTVEQENFMSSSLPDMRTITVKGVEFDTIDVGTGRPVVFLHGVLGDARTFAPHAEMLADRYRAITYTQRYFGTRPWPEPGPPFGIETHAQDLIGFVEALGAGPVFLVAWSYAGHAALRAAQLRPELFQAMFIYETGFQTFMTDAAEIAAFKADFDQLWSPVFAAINAGDTDGAARLLINASTRDEYYFDSRTELQMQIERENAPMLARLLAQTPPPRISADDLSQIEVKISLACGSKSRPAYKLISEAAMRHLPGQHFMIPGVNHFWPDAEPSAFTDFVRDWLGAQ